MVNTKAQTIKEEDMKQEGDMIKDQQQLEVKTLLKATTMSKIIKIEVKEISNMKKDLKNMIINKITKVDIKSLNFTQSHQNLS
jgi:hypothetical protein